MKGTINNVFIIGHLSFCFFPVLFSIWGFPGGASGKGSTWQFRRLQFDPWVRKIPWRRKWHLTSVPGKCYGQRSLAGYSSLARKESDTTEGLSTVQCTAYSFYYLRSSLIKLTGLFLTSLSSSRPHCRALRLERSFCLPETWCHLSSSLQWAEAQCSRLGVPTISLTQEGGRASQGQWQLSCYPWTVWSLILTHSPGLFIRAFWPGQVLFYCAHFRTRNWDQGKQACSRSCRVESRAMWKGLFWFLAWCSDEPSLSSCTLSLL